MTEWTTLGLDIVPRAHGSNENKEYQGVIAPHAYQFLPKIRE